MEEGYFGGSGMEEEVEIYRSTVNFIGDQNFHDGGGFSVRNWKWVFWKRLFA